MYYLNARYYDPEDGRFMTEDSYRGEIMNPETGHLYVYCTNNPVNYVDPSGHFAAAMYTVIKLVLVGGAVAYVSYSSWKNHSSKTKYAGRKIISKTKVSVWLTAGVVDRIISVSYTHLTSVQWSAIVNETTVVGAAETVPKEKKEVVEEENTKDSTTFQMKDGKKQTIFYGQDVRFEDKNGDLQEYDPSLVRVTESKSEQGEDLKDYQYENKEGDKKHYLPKDLSEETPVLMENGKYQISFAPIYGQETKNEEEKKTEDPGTDSVEDAVSQAEEAVRNISTDGSSEKEIAEDTEAVSYTHLMMTRIV